MQSELLQIGQSLNEEYYLCVLCGFQEAKFDKNARFVGYVVSRLNGSCDPDRQLA